MCIRDSFKTKGGQTAKGGNVGKVVQTAQGGKGRVMGSSVQNRRRLQPLSNNRQAIAERRRNHLKQKLLKHGGRQQAGS